MRREALAVNTEHPLSISGRRVMGIEIPLVSSPPVQTGVRFGLNASNSRSDDVMILFNRALKLVAELAEVESAVFRLAVEVKKTQRRVNALEKIFLPQFRDTLKYIASTLEERDREGMIIMKMIKRRRGE
jgi:V/A-type H+-transporting ATPase subunit D